MCLRAVSDTLKQAAATADGVAARFGGEEILIFLPNIHADEAFGIANEARRALYRLALPHPALGEGRIVTASFGVATVRGSAFSPNALISAAKACLSNAKRLGRDQVRTDRDLLDEAGLGISVAAA